MGIKNVEFAQIYENLPGSRDVENLIAHLTQDRERQVRQLELNRSLYNQMVTEDTRSNAHRHHKSSSALSSDSGSKVHHKKTIVVRSAPPVENEKKKEAEVMPEKGEKDT